MTSAPLGFASTIQLNKVEEDGLKALSTKQIKDFTLPSVSALHMPLVNNDQGQVHAKGFLLWQQKLIMESSRGRKIFEKKERYGE